MKLAIAVGIFLPFVQSVAGWGFLGHETVGYIAMQFLAPNALSFVQTSLANGFGSTLGGSTATWADTVRSTSAFSFTAPFHFVDAQDSPLSGSCSVSQTRDCASGTCILSAIANYTARLADTTLDAEQRSEALRFVVHFLGDVGQPLHVEALKLGGNQISAICSGVSTNLHAAWDTGITTKNINDNHGGTSLNYAADLVAEIKTGKFNSSAAGWLSCSSTTQPLAAVSTLEHAAANRMSKKAASVTPLACPLVWATEANSFDCSVVFNFATGQDLCTTSYFTNAVPVIDMQLAKQGLRLAAWLNVIFDGATHI